MEHFEGGYAHAREGGDSNASEGHRPDPALTLRGKNRTSPQLYVDEFSRVVDSVRWAFGPFRLTAG